MVYRDSTARRTRRRHGGKRADPTIPPKSTQTRFFDPRLRFINTLPQIWLMALSPAFHRRAATVGGSKSGKSVVGESPEDVISGWRRKARSFSRELSRLADQFAQYELTLPSGDHDENVEYDYQRHAQLYLLHTVVLTQVRLRMADRGLRLSPLARRTRGEHSGGGGAGSSTLFGPCFAATRGDASGGCCLLCESSSRTKPLLYVALDSGGKPGPFRQAKLLQATLRFLLSQLPRAGCLRETWQLLQTAYDMERGSRPSGMVVSEFDQLFRTALKNTLECISYSSVQWRSPGSRKSRRTLVSPRHDGARRSAANRKRAVRIPNDVPGRNSPVCSR